jgi:hypothetical protein
MIQQKIKGRVWANYLGLNVERCSTVAGIGLIENMNVLSSMQFYLQCLMVPAILWICGNNVFTVVTLN